MGSKGTLEGEVERNRPNVSAGECKEVANIS